MRSFAEDIKIITMATQDPLYQSLVDNLAASLKRIGLSEKLIIYNLDEDGDVRGGRRYGHIRCFKLELMRAHLEDGDTILFCDADVVFFRNPLNYIAGCLDRFDICAQRFAPSHFPHELGNLCLSLGVFAARPSDMVLDLLDPVLETQHPINILDEQELINAKLILDERYASLAVKILDVDAFIPGYHWLNRNPVSSHAYLLHYSHIYSAKDKISKMVSDQKWYKPNVPFSDNREKLPHV